MTVPLSGGGPFPAPDTACAGAIGVPPSLSWSVLRDPGPKAVPTPVSVAVERVHGHGRRAAVVVRTLPGRTHYRTVRMPLVVPPAR
ncbi:hypothetical protein GCM10010266_62570 [Streptomyces griseomycini]|nr:hypothetical protein GCM10010266_62570 [Streptomyces griseomycini]GGR50102.1 hypothetical protein GCM10015536_64650 [Streptomyces griseomycini]